MKSISEADHAHGMQAHCMLKIKHENKIINLAFLHHLHVSYVYLCAGENGR